MDYEIAVIGSGSAGKEAALLAAQHGRRVVVIEKETIGGTCFHRGCFAIRTLRACADAFHNRLFASRYGIDLDQTQVKTTGWAKVRRRVSSQLADQLSEQFQQANVSIRFGKATFLTDKTLRLFDAYGRWTELTAEQVVIATGSRPRFFAPAETNLLNSDQLAQMKKIEAIISPTKLEAVREGLRTTGIVGRLVITPVRCLQLVGSRPGIK